MRISNIILILTVLLISISGCLREMDVVDPVETTDYKQYGIFFNSSFYYPYGISTLIMNEGDTLLAHASSILLDEPKYSWMSDNTDIIKVIPNAAQDSLVTIIAVGDSGAVTTITLVDDGNKVKKVIPVRILKYWADPAIFTFLGKFQGHYYYISNHKKTWIEANEQCQASGGHLVTITSEDENLFIQNAPLRFNEDVWIGLTYLFDNLDLAVWITGEVHDYSGIAGAYGGQGPGIAAEYYFNMNEIGEWEQKHEKAIKYVLEMEP